MNNGYLDIIQDGCIVNDEIVERFDTLKEENLVKDGYSTFVGFIYDNKNNKLLFSFPKHFYKISKINNEINEDINSDIKLVMKLLYKYHNCLGTNEEEDKDNIPLKAIKGIFNYYNKYGLYHVDRKIYKEDFSGKILWKKTINSNNYIVSNYNIIYYPFIIEKKEDKFMFITDCMIYVINKMHEILPFYFKRKIIINIKINYNNFKNYYNVIKKLKSFLSQEFKDINRNLINDLIRFFEWMAKWRKETKFITSSFNNIWEKMINKYLSSDFMCIDEKNCKIMFSDNNNKYNFNKKEIKIGEFTGGKRSIEIDHYYKKDKEAYIFDSKYYNEIKQLDYKQVTYYYFILAKYKEIEKIYNALILPTSEESKTTIHLDRRKIDNLIIYECYVNTRKIIKKILRNEKV